jgi:hypothetical protein
MLRCATLACALSLAAPLQAGVIVVDPAGGSGAEALISALATAADGDILLLRPGDYLTGHPLPFEIEGRSLTIAADAGGARIELPGIAVIGTAAEQPVILRGLHLTRTPSGDAIVAALRVDECAGVVWVEDCDIDGPDAAPTVTYEAAGLGMRIGESARVVVARCTLQGGDGLDEDLSSGQVSTQGRSAVQVAGSFLAMFDSEAVGGQGGDGPEDFINPFGQGGAGVELGHGDVLLSGCHVVGGAEGAGTGPVTMPGPGIGSLFVSHAWLRDTLVEPGAEQVGGNPAPAIALPPENVFVFPAAARSLSVAAPLREGQPAEITIDGVQGDGVWLLAALDLACMPAFAKQGCLAIAHPVIALVASIGSPSGHLALPFTTPGLPASLDGLAVELQAVHFGSDGVTLGAPTSLLWISSTL